MAEQPEKLKYPVLDRLDHDDESYQPGDVVELTASEAALLLPLRVIGQALPPEQKEDKKAAKKDA